MADAYEAVKNKAVNALTLIDPSQPLGTALFDAVARITPVIAIETVAIRFGEGRTEVYLTKRADNDSTFPGHWHSPGSCLRKGENVEDVFRRLQKREFKTSFASEPRWFDYWNNPDGDPRGHTFHAMFLVNLGFSEESEKNWFAVDRLHELPDPIISYHRDVIIPKAVWNF